MRLFNRRPAAGLENKSGVDEFLDLMRDSIAPQRHSDLGTAVAACGRKELADGLQVVSAIRQEPPAALTDEIDRLIWLEAAGHTAAAQGLCTGIAKRFVAADAAALSPHLIRMVADGLLVERDFNRAHLLYERLASCTSWPECFFASCTARAIPRPEHAAAA